MASLVALRPLGCWLACLLASNDNYQDDPNFCGPAFCQNLDSFQQTSLMMQMMTTQHQCDRLWRNFATVPFNHLCCWWFFSVLTKIFKTYFGKLFCYLGTFSLLLNSKYWTDNPAIWSHCSTSSDDCNTIKGWIPVSITFKLSITTKYGFGN